MPNAELIVRTDAGREIGFGHLRRCLSLAEALRRLGANVVFALDALPSMVDRVRAAGFQVVGLRDAADPDETVDLAGTWGARAVVADSYALGPAYLGRLAHAGLLVVAIDDIGDRDLPAHVVVNGSPGAEAGRYCGPGQRILLVGPRYALLRAEFAREPERVSSERVRRVLITLGGSDPHQLTAPLAHWTARALPEAHLDVVIGPLHDRGDDVEASGQSLPETAVVHVDPSEMRSLMLAADLAVCAGGQTVLELAATATPAVVIRMAENQTAQLRSLAEADAVLWVGDAHHTDLKEKVIGAIRFLDVDPVRRAALGRRGRQLIDGGGADRVARAVLEAVTRAAA